MNYIGDRPPPEMYAPGLEIDYQCARCGSSMEAEPCPECGGDGVNGHECGEDCCACVDKSDNIPCDFCDGTGICRWCLSSADWCEANPLPGREQTPRGTIEWFTTEEPA